MIMDFLHRKISFTAGFILNALVFSISLFSKKFKLQTKTHKFIYYFLFYNLFSLSYNAQCAMCRASLSNESNKAKAEAVNDGIVYLMIIPYILVGGIFYWIYRMKKNQKSKT